MIDDEMAPVCQRQNSWLMVGRADLYLVVMTAAVAVAVLAGAHKFARRVFRGRSGFVPICHVQTLPARSSESVTYEPEFFSHQIEHKYRQTDDPQQDRVGVYESVLFSASRGHG